MSFLMKPCLKFRKKRKKSKKDSNITPPYSDRTELVSPSENQRHSQLTNPYINTNNADQDTTNDNVLKESPSNSPSDDGRTPSRNRHIDQNSVEENDTFNESRIEILEQVERPSFQTIDPQINNKDDEAIVTHGTVLRKSCSNSPIEDGKARSRSINLGNIDQNLKEDNETFNENRMETLQEGEPCQATYPSIKINDDKQNGALDNVLEESSSNSSSEAGKTPSRCRYIYQKLNECSETSKEMGVEILQKYDPTSSSESQISLDDKQNIGDSLFQNFESKTSSNISNPESIGSTDIFNKVTGAGNVFEIIEKISTLKYVSRMETLQEWETPLCQTTYPSIKIIEVKENGELDNAFEESRLNSPSEDGRTPSRCRYIDHNLNECNDTSNKMGVGMLQKDEPASSSESQISLDDKQNIGDRHFQNFKNKTSSNISNLERQVVQEDNLDIFFPRRELASTDQTKNTKEQNFTEFETPEATEEDMGSDQESIGSTDILNEVTVASNVFEIIEKINRLKCVSNQLNHNAEDKSSTNNENRIKVGKTLESISENIIPDKLKTEANVRLAETNLTLPISKNLIPSSENIKDLGLENHAQVKGNLSRPQLGETIGGVTEYEDKVIKVNLQPADEGSKITQVKQAVKEENVGRFFPRRELGSTDQTKNTNEQNFTEFESPEATVKDVGESNFQRSYTPKDEVGIINIIKCQVMGDSGASDDLGLNNVCKIGEYENNLESSVYKTCSTEYSDVKFSNDDLKYDSNQLKHNAKYRNLACNENRIKIYENNVSICEKQGIAKNIPDNLTTEVDVCLAETNLTLATSKNLIPSSESVNDLELEKDAQKGKISCPEIGNTIGEVIEHDEDKVLKSNLEDTDEESKVTQIQQVEQEENLWCFFPRRELSITDGTMDTKEKEFIEFEAPEATVKHVGESNVERSYNPKDEAEVLNIVKCQVMGDFDESDTLELNSFGEVGEYESNLESLIDDTFSTEYNSGKLSNDDSKINKNSENIESMSGDFVGTANYISRSVEKSDSFDYKIDSSIYFKESNPNADDCWVKDNYDIVRGLLLLEPVKQDGNFPTDTDFNTKDKCDSAVIKSPNELPASNVQPNFKSRFLCCEVEEENTNQEKVATGATDQELNQYSLANNVEINAVTNELSFIEVQDNFQSSSSYYDAKQENCNVEKTNIAETVCEVISNELTDNATPVNNVNSTMKYISSREETENFKINSQANYSNAVDSVGKGGCKMKQVSHEEMIDELKECPKNEIQEEFEENERLSLESTENILLSKNQTIEAMDDVVSNVTSKSTNDFNFTCAEDISYDVERSIAEKYLDIENELSNQIHCKIQKRENSVQCDTVKQKRNLIEEDTEDSKKLNSDTSNIHMSKIYFEFERSNVQHVTDALPDIDVPVCNKYEGHLNNRYIRTSFKVNDNPSNDGTQSVNLKKCSVSIESIKTEDNNFLQPQNDGTGDDCHIFQEQLTSNSGSNSDAYSNVRSMKDKVSDTDNENFSFFLQDLPVKSSKLSEEHKCETVNSDLMHFCDKFKLNKQTESKNLMESYMQDDINCHHCTNYHQEKSNPQNNSENIRIERFSNDMNVDSLLSPLNSIGMPEEESPSSNASLNDILEEYPFPFKFTSNYIESKFQKSGNFLPLPKSRNRLPVSKYSILSLSGSSGSSKLSLNEDIDDMEEKGIMRESFVTSPWCANEVRIDDKIIEGGKSHKNLHSRRIDINRVKVPKTKCGTNRRQELISRKESMVTNNIASRIKRILSETKSFPPFLADNNSGDNKFIAKGEHYKKMLQNFELKPPMRAFRERDLDQISDSVKSEDECDHLMEASSKNHLETKDCKNSNLERMEARRKSIIEAFKRQLLEATAEMTSNTQIIPIQKEGSFEFTISSIENNDKKKNQERALRQVFVENKKDVKDRNAYKILPFSQHKETENKKMYSSVKCEENKRLDVEQKLIYRTLSSDTDSDTTLETSSINMMPDRKRILNASRAIRSPKNAYKNNPQTYPNRVPCSSGPLMFPQGNLVSYVTEDEKTNSYEIKKGVKLCNACSKRFKYKSLDSENVNFDLPEEKKDCSTNRSVTPDELKGKFDEKFKSYASKGRRNGELISYKRSTEWLRDAGVVGNEMTAQEANGAFKCTAGMKVALNKDDYRYFLKKISRLKRLNYNEIYERMCAASRNKCINGIFRWEK